MVNKVILIGNLGRDPEIRELEGGAKVASFSVATNENYRDKSGNWQTITEWHNVVLWRNMAERAETQLKKGSLIYIDGKLTHRSWEDKDGIKRYTTEVVANYFRNLTSRDEVAQMPGGSDVSTNALAGQMVQEPQSGIDVSDTDSSESNPEEDLPF